MEYPSNVIPLFPGQKPHCGAFTFKDLADAWFESSRAGLVCPENEGRHIRHLAPLWDKDEAQLRPRMVKQVLAQLAGALGPATLNKVRNTGRRIIREAILNDEWDGQNPFDAVPRLRESRPVYRILSLAEARVLIPHLKERRKREALLMLYLGARPGEMKALRREDVDMVERTVTIRRSNGRDRTKTGKQRKIPIPGRLLPHLEAALAASPPGCPHVFPNTEGKRQRNDAKLSKMLHSAMKRAGLVTGYRYHCRRKGCGHKEERRTKEDARCPKCNFKLWAEGVPLDVRFYDLRHSAATIHHQAGADPLAIQIALGHAPESLTQSLYTHLSMDDIRRELNKLEI